MMAAILCVVEIATIQPQRPQTCQQAAIRCFTAPSEVYG